MRGIAIAALTAVGLSLTGCASSGGTSAAGHASCDNVVDATSELGKEVGSAKVQHKCSRVADKAGNQGSYFKAFGELDPTSTPSYTAEMPMAPRLFVGVIRYDTMAGTLQPFNVKTVGDGDLHGKDLGRTVPVMFGGQPANANLFSLQEPDTKITYACLGAEGRGVSGTGAAVFVCRGFKLEASDEDVANMAKTWVARDFDAIRP